MPSDAELNKQLVRTYMRVVFSERQADRAGDFLAADVIWQHPLGGLRRGLNSLTTAL